MNQRDYLMRILEEMGKRLGNLIAQVANQREAGQFAEAHDSLEEAVERLVSLKLQQLLAVDPDALLTRLQQEKVIWGEQAAFLAILLREDGRLMEAEGRDGEAYARLAYALRLMLGVADASIESSLEMSEVETTHKLVAEAFHLDGVLSQRLMQFYERQGWYAAAEDVLYEWLESETAVYDLDIANPLTEGVAFYERLMLLDDDRLTDGDLPRAEVEAGLVELNGRLQ